MKRSFTCVILCLSFLAGCAQGTFDSSDLDPPLGDQLPADDAGAVDASLHDAWVAPPVDAARAPNDASVVVDASRPSADAGRDASSVLDAGGAIADAATPTVDASTECPACPFPGSSCMTILSTCGCQLIPIGPCLLPPLF